MRTLRAGGSWTVKNVQRLEDLVSAIGAPQTMAAVSAVDAHDIKDLDTYGATLLHRLAHARPEGIEIINIPDRFLGLYGQLSRVSGPSAPPRGATRLPTGSKGSAGPQRKRAGTSPPSPPCSAASAWRWSAWCAILPASG